MIDINATELKNRLGRYLDLAETKPVLVKKSGRPKSVLISHDLYQKFMAFEDFYWAQKAADAESDGYLGDEASEKVLKEQLDA